MAADVAHSATAQAKESLGREAVESTLDWYLPPEEIEFTTETGPTLGGGVPWNRIGHFRTRNEEGELVCGRWVGRNHRHRSFSSVGTVLELSGRLNMHSSTKRNHQPDTGSVAAPNECEC